MVLCTSSKDQVRNCLVIIKFLQAYARVKSQFGKSSVIRIGPNGDLWEWVGLLRSLVGDFQSKDLVMGENLTSKGNTTPTIS